MIKQKLFICKQLNRICYNLSCKDVYICCMKYYVCSKYVTLYPYYFFFDNICWKCDILLYAFCLQNEGFVVFREGILERSNPENFYFRKLKKSSRNYRFYLVFNKNMCPPRCPLFLQLSDRKFLDANRRYISSIQRK